jgi:selenide, water dikinase
LKQLLLIGGGHAHVEVLRQLALRPQHTAQVTLVSPDAHTPYSGMLPGLVAGHYTHDETHVALLPLAQAAGARFVPARVTALNAAARQVTLSDGSSVSYDIAAIDIGSTPFVPEVPGLRETALLAKPVDVFLEGWAQIRKLFAQGALRRLAVVGGGAGGVELMLAMHHALKTALPPDKMRSCGFSIITDTARLLPAHPPRAAAAITRLFAERGISVFAGARVTALAREGDATLVTMANGATLATDVVVWVTGARPAPWLATSGLAVDAQGFLSIGEDLRITNDAHVFASGDCATSNTDPRPKSGVYAVRQGPVLARNLVAALAGLPLEAHKPQATALALVSTGNQGAIAVRGQWTMPFMQTLQWRWKDKIDRAWMAKYAPSALERQAAK